MLHRLLKYTILVIGIASIVFLVIKAGLVLTAEPASAPVIQTPPVSLIPDSSPDLVSSPASATTAMPVTVPAVVTPTVIKKPRTTSSAPLSSIPTVPVAPVVEKPASSTVLLIQVPFTAQAPLGEWSDQRQQDGCEEAAAAMAMAWVNNEKSITKDEWLTRILAIADFEQEKYGEHRDVSSEDVIAWIFEDYYGYNKVSIKAVASSSDILRELERGHIVLIPTDGRALHNPYFSPPGPEEHMIVIKGYDYKTGQFIVNDPGTRRGESYRYSSVTIFSAIRPYYTGYKLPFPKTLVREMIVVEK